MSAIYASDYLAVSAAPRTTGVASKVSRINLKENWLTVENRYRIQSCAKNEALNCQGKWVNEKAKEKESKKFDWGWILGVYYKAQLLQANAQISSLTAAKAK